MNHSPIDYEAVRKRLAGDAPGDVRVFGAADALRVKSADRLVTGTITKAVVDVDGEVVLPWGVDTSLFPTVYKTVYLNHDTSQPVGACRHMKASGDELVAQTYVSKTPLGQDVMTMIEEGVIGGQSVGFYVLEASAPTHEETRRYGPSERVIRKWMLREYSFTPMPACPGASDLRPLPKGTDPEMMQRVAARVDEMVTKGMIHRSSAVAAGLLDSPTRRLFDTTGTAPARADRLPTKRLVFVA